MSISFTMITVPRPESYAEATIKSFRDGTTETLWLMIGKQADDYLTDYPHRLPATPEQQKTLEGKELRYRAVWNYIRALSLDGNDTLVLEDDIVFSKGWRAHLDKSIEAANKYTNKYVMTLYVPSANESGDTQFTFPIDEYKKGNYISTYPEGKMYGTQAMYFPSVILPQCIEYFQSQLGKAPHDYIIRDFCRTHRYPIFATAPCLVQHIGIKTTGLAGKHHVSQCFLENVNS